MQSARFIRALALFCVLGLAGAMVGCGSQAQPHSAEAGKVIAASLRKHHAELKEAKKANSPNVRRGKMAGKAGP